MPIALGDCQVALAPRNGTAAVATFPVRPGEDAMPVIDRGQLIRAPAAPVRITGRQAMGVTLVRVTAGEHVSSVFPVVEDETDENGAPEPGAAEDANDA
jgi:DNA gyrase subunit A